MTRFKTSISALALMAMAAGGLGAVTLLPASLHAQASQNAPAPAPTADTGHHHHGFDRARFVEGRIAFIKAVLKITPAQEGQFDKLADAMRANTQDRMDAFKQMHDQDAKPMNAVDRLEMRERMSKMRVESEDRILTAFKPLYATLAPDQQQLADHMLAAHGHGGMHRHHG